MRPGSGWDARLDFAAEGYINEDHVARFERLAPLGQNRLPARPTTACFHYGWYGPGRRQRETPTVRYLGGNYQSTDRRTEEEFNDLKAEFGIDADILSWIDDREVLRAFERGYLSAANRGTRRFGLLYESQINLRARGRLSMERGSAAATKLIHDFRAMGAWLRDAASTADTEILFVDGRPVVYVFGSHTFGVNDGQLPDVGRALARARSEFAETFGTVPYLIGDESLFPGDPEVRIDRRYRAAYFDAVTRYHHYDEAFIRELGDGETVNLDADYVKRIVELEQRSAAGFDTVRNRYSDRRVRAIPSAAAGFAKRGLPTLQASRHNYETLLDAMQELVNDAHRGERRRRLAVEAGSPPLVLLGSWNEEFEGHALLPASRSAALADDKHSGFDWLFAIKSRYGSVPPR